jgi:hypothetical protein
MKNFGKLKDLEANAPVVQHYRPGLNFQDPDFVEAMAEWHRSAEYQTTHTKFPMAIARSLMNDNVLYHSLLWSAEGRGVGSLARNGRYTAN